MKDFFTITCSSFPNTTRVAGFSATEALSRPHEVKVYLLVPSDDLELADAVGAKATLVVDRAADGIAPFYFAGVVAIAELLHDAEGMSLVEAVIVPPLWYLGLSMHSRIFTKLSVVEIIEKIFEENDLTSDDYELRLGSYPTEEHVCQYHESDLAFVSRWMEREGIYYWFEHTEDGVKVILSDDKGYASDPIGKPVTFMAQLGEDRSAGASLQTFRARHTSLPGSVRLRDYDYAKPKLDVSGSATVSSNGMTEVSVYGHRFFSPGEGNRLAQIRAEELKVQALMFQAAGTRLHLRPGYAFELEEHPRPSMNDEYLTISATHSGNQGAVSSAFKRLMSIDRDDVYFVELQAIPKETQFRPARTTAWPRIYGFENGVICGAADSEYAQIDDHGRYNVKFNFDESDLKDGEGSTYVRMMQPHGGGVEGFHFPLRKGTEVVFSFMGGDPDRPVISGVVPNLLTPSPVTSSNHTRNVLQTGGRNRLEIEDLADQQRITLSTPYSNTYVLMGAPNEGSEFILHTEDNTWFNAGHDMRTDVGISGGSGNYQLQVQGWYHTFVKQGDYALVVESSTWTTTVKGDSNFHVTNGEWQMNIDAGPWHTYVSGGDTTLRNTSSNTTIVSDAGTMTITGQTATTVESKSATIDLLSAQKAQLISSGSDVYIEGTTVTLKSRGDKHHQILGGDYTEVNGTKNQLVKGSSRTITIGAAQAVFIGGKNTITVSAELSNSLSISHATFLGAKSTITIAAMSDIAIAAKFGLELGVAFKLNGSVATELKSAAVHARAAYLAQNTTQMSFCGFSLKA